jgi:hypothetical protein
METTETFGANGKCRTRSVTPQRSRADGGRGRRQMIGKRYPLPRNGPGRPGLPRRP